MDRYGLQKLHSNQNLLRLLRLFMTEHLNIPQTFGFYYISFACRCLLQTYRLVITNTVISLAKRAISLLSFGSISVFSFCEFTFLINGVGPNFYCFLFAIFPHVFLTVFKYYTFFIFTILNTIYFLYFKNVMISIKI